MDAEPKYHVNQMLRCLHDWAKDHPARPVEDVMWDDCWHCFTYAFPLSLIRIEEYELEPVNAPDMTPQEWLDQYQKVQADR
jgi:hypothetical protein